MKIYSPITVDTRHNKFSVSVFAVQDDNATRYLSVRILDGGAPIVIPDNTQIVFQAKKTDGTLIFNDCPLTADGKVEVKLTHQILSVPGKVHCEIAMYGESNQVLTSAPFIINVSEKVVQDDEVESTSEFSALTAALSTVKKAIAGAESAALQAGAATGQAAIATEQAVTAAAAANTATENAEQATDQAGSAAAAANTATENAGQATGQAAIAAGQAVTAAEAALSAAASANTATENAEQAIADIASATVTKYGVRFGGSANIGATVTRLHNAFGLVSGVGTDTQTAMNDFDGVYPWSARRRCCGSFDTAGNFVVNAYAGEPGYTTDGTGGEVWVEHSLFYFKHAHDGDAEEIVISAFPIGGFSPAPIFVKPDGTLLQKAYTAAYPLATVDGKATSRSGVFSDTCSLNSAMTAARTLGANYTTTTTAEWYTDCLYMWVEFATRNLQAAMMGASELPYTVTDTATVAETAAGRMIVAAAVANKFVVGQTIGIGTSLGGTNIAANRIVTATQEYDADNKAILFDGSPINVAVGNIIWTSAYINGSCDGVLSSSGSPVSNTSGKYNCTYRGKETPYGNAYEWIADVLFKKTEIRFSYDVYYLPDPTKYTGGAITANYVKLAYQLPMRDGYVGKLGFDSRYPYVRLPTFTEAGSTTHYSDFFYAPGTDQELCAAIVGGGWNSAAATGVCCWCCYIPPMSSGVYRRGRLSFHRS